MSARQLRGVPASPGIAVAAVRHPPRAASALGAPVTDRAAEVDRARAALEAAAVELETIATGLRDQCLAAEADIVATGALMARDPTLVGAVAAAITSVGLPAAEAIVRACAEQADVLAELDDPMLASRADDVRSLGRRAALRASPDAASPAEISDDHVLVADDLGPADVADLDARVRAIAIAGGGPTAHAAIVARSLGLPMVTGLGRDVLALADGEEVIVDGDAGVVVASPALTDMESARAAARRRDLARERGASARGLPAETLDGRRITVLANVAGRGELALAVQAGAEGVGLVRTELAFLEAHAWPTVEEHRRALGPLLSAMEGRPVTVRVLDFGGDKLPPFLDGARERGIRLLLSAPEALDAQLRAILDSGPGPGLRIMLPLVNSTVELVTVARALVRVAGDAGVPVPPLGAMIETPRAAGNADALARCSGFLSIGTNDLTAATLGVDRFDGGHAATHHPRVLAAIARTVDAARRAGIPIEVCGEAASDPIVMPLLVGLGVDEVSVGASRVGAVRAWVRSLVYDDVRALATQALEATTTEAVEQLMAATGAALLSVERGETGAQGVERDNRVVAAGGQP